MIEIGILAASCFVNALLGLVVFLKNPKSTTNKLFVFLSGSFASWSIVNYFSIHPVLFSQLTWVRLVLFFAAPQILAFYLTSAVFPSYNRVGNRRHQNWAILATAFVMILTQTPYVFKLDSHGKPVPNFAIGFFAILIFTLLISGIFTLITKFRRARGKEKDQLRLVLFGFIGTFSLIFLTNFLLVVVLKNTALIPLGPTYTLVFSSSFAYAIIKHRLFDIRAAAARGLAYILSFGSIGLVYGGLVFGVGDVLSQQSASGNVQRGFYIIFALLTALIYPRTKQFFDKITNRFFFRDAYDPQLFLDNLNSVLVRNIDLERLLTDTITVLSTNLKPDYVVFSINKTAYFPQRMIGDNGNQFSAETGQELTEAASRYREKVIVADYLEAGHGELKRVMTKHDVAVLVRLVTPISPHTSNAIGYIMFGPKKSGNPYNKLDIRMLDIIGNELVIAIQNGLRFEEIEKFTITLQAKVNDATRQLRATNEKLRQLDATKDDFISMASHQLRTPLTSVKGYVSMVLDGDSGKISGQQRKLLDQAFVSSQRMVYLIADLLNVSRLKTGKFVIDAKPTNLVEVVEGELGQLKETAKSRGLKIEFAHPKKFPILNLDETKIRQVIMNFSDNAIYYTPSGGTITVGLEDKPESVELTVSDNGIGVPKAEQHHLFTKFYRAGNAKKARPDGTGLGLFMAQKVIVAQGGAIIFHSEEGKGSTFGFSFPKNKLLIK